MARAAYITRRGQTYWLQKRIILPRPTWPPCGSPIVRFSLRTREYSRAVRRMLGAMETITGYEVAAAASWPHPTADHAADLEPEVDFLLSEIARAEADLDVSDYYTKRRAVEAVCAAMIDRARALDYPLVARHPRFWPTWQEFVQRQIAIDDRRTDVLRKHHRTNERTWLAHQTPSRLELPDIAEDTVGAHQLSRVPAIEATGTDGRAINRVRPDLDGPMSRMDDETCAAIPEAPYIVRPVRPGEDVPFETVGMAAEMSPTTVGGALADDERAIDAATLESDPITKLDRHSSVSAVLNAYLDHRKAIDGDDRASDDVALPVRFMADLLDDPKIGELGPKMFMRVDAALVNVPNRTNIPRDNSYSLHARYEYARSHGWSGLHRISRKRIRNSWHRGLHQFLDWAIKLHLLDGPRFEFNEVSSKNRPSKDVDAWSDDEVLKLFSLPLFVGSQNAPRHWTEGSYLVQNGIYWGYVIAFMTGMRASEIGRLMVDSLIERDGRHYFDLRSVPNLQVPDAAGRKVGPTQAVLPERTTKTSAGERLVPVPILLLDLGLLDHACDVRCAGHVRLFPDWNVYTRPDGRPMWGHYFSKSWAYVRKRFDFERKDLRLHGG